MFKKVVIIFPLFLLGSCKSAFDGFYEAIACNNYSAPVMEYEPEAKSCGVIPRCQALNMDGQVIRIEWEDGVKLKLQLAVVGDAAAYDNITDIKLITEKPAGIFSEGERNVLQGEEWYRGGVSLELERPMTKHETYTLFLSIRNMERGNEVKKEIQYKLGKIKSCVPLV